MKTYLEGFLLSVFAGLITAAVTINIPKTVRFVVIVVSASLAFFAAIIAEKISATSASHSETRRRGLMIAGLSISTVVLLGYVLKNSVATEVNIKKPPLDSSKAPSNSAAPQNIDNEPISNSVSRSHDAPRQHNIPTSVTPEDVFMKTYVAAGTPNDAARAWTIVLVATVPNEFAELRSAAEAVLVRKGYLVRPLFRSALSRNPTDFDELYSGNPALMKKVAAYRDGLLLGKLRMELSHDTSFDIVSTHLFADFRLIDTQSAQIRGEFTVDGLGAGFSDAASAAAAENRTADKLKEKLSQLIANRF